MTGLLDHAEGGGDQSLDLVLRRGPPAGEAAVDGGPYGAGPGARSGKGAGLGRGGAEQG